MKRLLNLTFLLIVTFSTFAQAENSQELPIAKNFSIETLSEQSFHLSEYKEQTVLIVFWATWCPYCKKLLPGIERLHNKYKEDGLKVIAITILEDGDPKSYIERHGYTFTVGLNGDNLRKDYRVPGTPTVAILTKNNQWHAHLRTSDPDSIELENAIRSSLGLDPINN